MYRKFTPTGMKTSTKIWAFFEALFIFIIILLSAMEFQSLDLKFYNDFQQEANIKQTYNIDKDLNDLNKRFVTFLKTQKIEYIEKDFNKKEVLHLKDCVEIYKNAYILRNILLTFFVLIMVLNRKQKNFTRKISSYLFLLGILFLGFLVYIMLNFESSFITFHHIFFDNDLWILDPSKDLLIQIMPIEFFIESVRRIIILFFIIFCLMFLTFRYMERR